MVHWVDDDGAPFEAMRVRMAKTTTLFVTEVHNVTKGVWARSLDSVESGCCAVWLVVS
jgi:hypothetical protein